MGESIWNGTALAAATHHVWNGTALVAANVSIWNGTALVAVGSTPAPSFVVGTTKPTLAGVYGGTTSNVGAGVIRPYPTTSNTTSMAGTTISTAQTLTAQYVTGDLIVSASGVTVKDSIITGQVTVKSGAANVLFENCVFYGGNTTGNAWMVGTWTADPTNPPKFSLCTFDPTNPQVGLNAIGWCNYTLDRCTWHNVVDGCSVYPNTSSGPVNVSITGCLGYDLAQFRPDTINSRTETHNDHIQQQGGTGLIVKGNAFYGYYSTTAGYQPPYASYTNLTCLQISPTTNHTKGAVSFTFDDNWCYGGGGVGLNALGMGAQDTIVSMKRNKCDRDMFASSPSRTPLGLNTNASNGGLGSGADANTYTDNGATIPVYYSSTVYA